MNVRPRRPTRRTDFRELLAAFDELSLANVDFTRVGVHRTERSGMFHDDDFAVASETSGMNDAARLRSIDRCPTSSRDIDPLMGPPPAHPESGAQSAPNGPREAEPTLLTCSLARTLLHRTLSARGARWAIRVGG